MVYVKYNRALQRRYERRDTIDPILLEDVDESNEWLLGTMDENSEEEDLVFEGDDLTWSAVSRATEANEPTYATRGVSRVRRDAPVAPASSSRVDKGKRPMMIDDDDDDKMKEDIGEDADYGEDADLGAPRLRKARACALRLGSEDPLRLGAPRAF